MVALLYTRKKAENETLKKSCCVSRENTPTKENLNVYPTESKRCFTKSHQGIIYSLQSGTLFVSFIVIQALICVWMCILL